MLLVLSRTGVGVEEIAREDPARVAAFAWERLVTLALYHRVFPLVQWNLRRLGVEGIPSSVAERLGAYFDRNRFRIMGLTAELLALAKKFDSAGVRAVWLKGPALASAVYGNVALRPAGDLDVLVDPGGVPAALEILKNRGYRIRLGALSEAASKLHSVKKFSEMVGKNFDRSVELETEEGLASHFQSEMCETFGNKARLFLLRKAVPNRSDIAAADWKPPFQFLYYIRPIRRLFREAHLRCLGRSTGRHAKP